MKAYILFNIIKSDIYEDVEIDFFYIIYNIYNINEHFLQFLKYSNLFKKIPQRQPL
jgi:hypothetical protein